MDKDSRYPDIRYVRFPVLCLIICLSLGVLTAGTFSPASKSAEVAAELCRGLVLENPVILDIRCGEWTVFLEKDLRNLLLSRQADIRETGIGIVYSAEDEPGEELLQASRTNLLLSNLNLKTADLLQVSLEQSVITTEKRKMIAYARYQTPVYKFSIKQIRLPEQRLVSQSEYVIQGEPEAENPGSILAMKWYEPVVATAMMASLLMMLWTLK